MCDAILPRVCDYLTRSIGQGSQGQHLETVWRFSQNTRATICLETWSLDADDTRIYQDSSDEDVVIVVNCSFPLKKPPMRTL